MNDALISNLTEQRDLYKELAVKAADRITKLEATLDVALDALKEYVKNDIVDEELNPIKRQARAALAATKQGETK